MLLAVAAAAVTAAVTGPARAAAMIIWPVDPIIQAGQTSTVIWVQNRGAEPVNVQVRAFAWNQAAGQDVLERQGQVVASPPIAQIAPGARQLIRVVQRAPGNRPQQAFRLIVDELPAPPSADASSGVTAKLAIQMRYSIPLFVYGTRDKLAPALAAEVRAGPDGRVLVIRNTGTSHARLTDLRGAGDAMLREGLLGYVLPDATIELPIPTNSGATIKLGVNGIDQTLSFAA